MSVANKDKNNYYYYNEDKNNYYYNVFLEKSSYKESNTEYF